LYWYQFDLGAEQIGCRAKPCKIPLNIFKWSEAPSENIANIRLENPLSSAFNYISHFGCSAWLASFVQ
jgi:hypothetical protein